MTDGGVTQSHVRQPRSARGGDVIHTRIVGVVTGISSSLVFLHRLNTYLEGPFVHHRSGPWETPAGSGWRDHGLWPWLTPVRDGAAAGPRSLPPACVTLLRLHPKETFGLGQREKPKFLSDMIAGRR